jgi:NAD(P)-dependent dehydrogenase (short-subunit alcohol dehydrogenase family)
VLVTTKPPTPVAERAAGAVVVLADRDPGAVDDAAEQLTPNGATAIGVRCDVTDEGDVAAMVARSVAEFGRVDMAFNNAGIMVPPCDAAETSSCAAAINRQV